MYSVIVGPLFHFSFLLATPLLNSQHYNASIVPLSVTEHQVVRLAKWQPATVAYSHVEWGLMSPNLREQVWNREAIGSLLA